MVRERHRHDANHPWTPPGTRYAAPVRSRGRISASASGTAANAASAAIAGAT